MKAKERITKKEFYNMGGFARSNLFRIMKRNVWTYWRAV